MRTIAIFLITLSVHLQGASINQTEDVSPIYLGDKLPFKVHVELSDFSLPTGLHSGVKAVWEGKWVILAGRTNGLHGFNNTGDFPPDKQNTVVYVINPQTGAITSKDLNDSTSGLTPAQIDLLSVTSPQSYQYNKSIYMTGGYGIDTATGNFSTKPFLTAIDLPELIEWVENPSPTIPLISNIRWLENPVFKITGGYMNRGEGNLTLLILGQNFEGQYTPSSNGDYSNQVRRFYIHDNGKLLSVKFKKSRPGIKYPDYRRRDLNIVPIVRNLLGESAPSFVALSGVFTPQGGIWTVPILINTNGKAEMANPNDPSTFKQGMNNYVCPVLGMYSAHIGSMFLTLFGGLSYGYFDADGFQTDSEIPFTNQITTIKYDQKAKFKQYLMESQYPVIPSNFSNPGNPLLFGAGAFYFPAPALPLYDNHVVKYDKLNKGSSIVGYIVGGIVSTLPNTNTMADSGASPYIFKVVLEKK